MFNIFCTSLNESKLEEKILVFILELFLFFQEISFQILIIFSSFPTFFFM